MKWPPLPGPLRVLKLVPDAFAADRFEQFKKLGVFDHPLLEAERLGSGGVGFGGRLLAQQAAEVAKMLLVGRGFLAGKTRPFPLELGGGHWLVPQVCPGFKEL